MFASRDEAYANYAAKPPFAVLAPEALRAYVDHGFADEPDGTVRLRCRPEVEAEIYRMGWPTTRSSLLRRRAVPRRRRVRRADRAFTPPLVARQAEALPHGRLDVLPGLGHFGPLEDPGAVAESVLRAFALA